MCCLQGPMQLALGIRAASVHPLTTPGPCHNACHPFLHPACGGRRREHPRCGCCALPRLGSWSSALRTVSIVVLQVRSFHPRPHCCRPVANPTRDGALVAWSSMSRLSVSSSSHLRLAQQQAPRRCHVVTRVCPNACRLANAAHGAHWPPTLSHHDAFAMPQAAVPGRRQMVPMVS